MGCDVSLLGSCQEWGVVVCAVRVVDRELVGDLSSLAFAPLSSPGFVSPSSLAFSLMLRLRVVRSSSGRRKGGDVGGGCCVGVDIVKGGLGLGEKVMREKRATTNVVACF